MLRSASRGAATAWPRCPGLRSELCKKGMDDNYDHEPEEPELPQKPRDRKIDEAKEIVFQRYFAEGQNVYYGRQLEIWMEKEFFHWITKRALNELVAARRIGFTPEQLEHHRAHFYYPRSHRYPRRQIRESIGLIGEFSNPDFTRAVGHHGELLIKSAFARTGFQVRQQKVTAVDGKAWIESGHDLDFLIERDGIRYGVEVKNQLGYIDQDELEIKLAMCERFGVRPMFCVRVMPANYFYDIIIKGGYVLVTQNQNYPLLAGDLARRVRKTLSLPVAVIQRLPNSALARFEKFHTCAG